MKRFLFFGSALLVLLGGLWYADTRLVAPPPPPDTPTPLPTHTPESTPTPAAAAGPRVVVLSLAGAQAGRVDAYIADGTMPNLARLKAQGAMAQYALSVDPALSAPAHAALASGAYPAETGVVADRYHQPGDDPNAVVDALAQAPLGAEPIWRTAMREARRTAALFWPCTSLDLPAGLADYTVTPGAVDAPSAQHVVTLTETLAWPGAPPSFSSLREGTLAIAKNGAPMVRVHVLAVDTSNDGQENPDTFILDRERLVLPTSARLRLGETAPLAVDDLVVSGAYFTVTRVDPGQVTLYQSPVCYNQAQPDELVREVNRRFGFFPPAPDGQALRQGWISPGQYLRMAEVQSRWMISVTTFVLDAYRPELLFAWQGPADDLQREFLLVDPAQPGYTPERAAECDRYLRRGYALADEAAGALAGALDLEGTTLLVVSDRGAAPVHSLVSLNTMLSAHKLLVYEPGPARRVNGAESKAFAVASGGAGHIYINLRGRERLGAVPEADYLEVQDAVVEALQQLKGADGQPVFARVVRRDALGELNLRAPAAGDLFVQAAPGYALGDAPGGTAPLGPAAAYGQGGFEASLPEMHAIFLAAGRGVHMGPEVGPVHVLDLAPTVSRLLGLQQTLPLSGRVLEEMLLPIPG